MLWRDWLANLIQDRWSALSQWAGKPHSIAGTIVRRPVALYIVELIVATTVVHSYELFSRF